MKKSTLNSLFKRFKKKFKQFELHTESAKLKKSYKELEGAYKALSEYKAELEKKVDSEIKKRLQHEMLMMQQSRFVAMGEMMDAVAHQWIQPLSLISMYSDTLKHEINNESFDRGFFKEMLESIDRQNSFMESTLHEFRNFLNPFNEESVFELNKAVKKSLSLIEDEFLMNKIDIFFKKSGETLIQGNGKEVQHVIINILNNAKDAFREKKTKNPKITISLKEKGSKLLLYIDDNAGGIDELIINKIFNPYVSTKKSDGGSGMGLYMSQLIMDKHNARISVQNHNGGARFILHFNKGDSR